MASSSSSYGGGAPSKIITPATCMCDDASSRWRKEASSPVRRSVDMALKITSERQAQLIVGDRLAGGLGEPRHPHPEEAHRAARIEASEKLESDRPHGFRVVHRRLDA